MARILLVTGMLANIPYYHQAWLFEPLSFLLCWTAVTTMKMAITPSPTGCQAGRGRKLTRVGKKLLALDGRTPDHSGICPATLTSVPARYLRLSSTWRHLLVESSRKEKVQEGN